MSTKKRASGKPDALDYYHPLKTISLLDTDNSG
jgi:hypothetical protein